MGSKVFIVISLENFNTVEGLVSGNPRDAAKVHVTGAGRLWECNMIQCHTVCIEVEKNGVL